MPKNRTVAIKEALKTTRLTNGGAWHKNSYKQNMELTEMHFILTVL